MIKRKEVNQLLSLYADLLDSMESLRNNLYSTSESLDEWEMHRELKELGGAIVDMGDIAKEMDDQLLAKEIRNGTREDEE